MKNENKIIDNKIDGYNYDEDDECNDKIEKYGYFFTTARNQKSGEFELHSFLEITPNDFKKIGVCLDLIKDEVFKMNHNMNNIDICKASMVNQINDAIYCMNIGAKANQALMCYATNNFPLTREDLNTYLKFSNYDQIIKYKYSF